MQEPVRIFGPPGISYLLQSTLGFTDTRLTMPVIAAEWTVDPNGASTPTPDPRVLGLSCAKVAPDSDCKTSYRAGPEPSRSGDEEHLTGLDLHVSHPEIILDWSQMASMQNKCRPSCLACQEK